jgi:hypothetical protein
MNGSILLRNAHQIQIQQCPFICSQKSQQKNNFSSKSSPFKQATQGHSIDLIATIHESNILEILGK